MKQLNFLEGDILVSLLMNISVCAGCRLFLRASPPDWMLSAAFHVWTWRRSRESAKVEGQGSGGRSGGVPAPESIKHLNIGGRIQKGGPEHD